MTKQKVKIRFYNVSGQKCVMDVYKVFLGAIYKALRDDARVYDITIADGYAYPDYIRQFGGLVID